MHGALLLQTIIGQPWAVSLPFAAAMVGTLDRWVSGARLDPQQVQAAVAGAPERMAARRESARRVRSVAVLPLHGVIAHRAHMVARTSSGAGTSTELFAREFRALMADPSVAHIVIDVESPGGSVAGTPELVEVIRAARGRGKRIVAVANASAASAAYWIATAADEVIATPSASVGSVGVVVMHEDRSAADAQAGRRISYVTAGRFKAEGNPHAPLDSEARRHLQALVDTAYAEMVAQIARTRGLSVEHVRERFGQGRLLTPEDARRAGMLDGIETLDQVIDRLARGGKPRLASTSSAARLEPRLRLAHARLQLLETRASRTRPERGSA
jgi:signal peptide peptidase SppA